MSLIRKAKDALSSVALKRNITSLSFGLVMVVLAVAIAMAVIFWQLHSNGIGRPTASVIVGGIGAFGTVLATATATALGLAISGAQREERLRHEAVRPIVTMNGMWTRISPPPPQQESSRLRLRLIHVSGDTGLGVYLTMRPLQPGGTTLTVGSRSILRPISLGVSRDDFGRDAGQGFIDYDITHDQYTIGKMWRLNSRMRDIYGWWWEQESYPFSLVNTTLDMPDEGWPLTILMSDPVRVDGPWVDELKQRAAQAQ